MPALPEICLGGMHVRTYDLVFMLGPVTCTVAQNHSASKKRHLCMEFMLEQ